ncbi:MAG: pilin [bacterium]|nr:pilin [bacterium]
MKPILSLLVVSLLLSPGSALAFNTIAPINGATNVEVDAYFQWQEAPGATKYILDITKFTQSEDNIPSSVCAGGVCSFAFLSLSVGRIDYADSYVWKVTAYNPAGNPVDDSNPASFSTEQAPQVVAPPGGGPGGGPPIIDPSQLNPIASETLQELLENVLNFLFGLSIVILPIIVLYGGILLLTAQGEPEKISRARTILLWAIIAFAIILVARGLPAVLRNLL